MEPTTRLEATTPVRASTTPLEAPGGLSFEGAITDPLPAVGFDPFSLILNLFSGSDSAGLFGSSTLADLFGTIWGIFVIIAMLLSMFFLALYIYASMWRWYYYGDTDRQLREAEALYDSQFRGVTKNSRLDDIQAHTASENPNDWKLAIIEADIILDGILKDRGYAGATLGERLRSIAPSQLSSLQDAWEAHKVRNMIAHEGPDFVLTKRMAEDTIKRYLRVFAEFGLN